MIMKAIVASVLLVAGSPATAQGGDKLLCSHRTFAEPQMREAALMGKPDGRFGVIFAYHLRPKAGVADGKIDAAGDTWLQLGWQGVLDARTGRVAYTPNSFQISLGGKDPLLSAATPLTLFVEAGGRRMGPYPASDESLGYGLYEFSGETSGDPGTTKVPLARLMPLFAAIEAKPEAVLILAQGGRDVAKIPVAAPPVAAGKATVAEWAAASAKARAGGKCLAGDHG